MAPLSIRPNQTANTNVFQFVRSLFAAPVRELATAA
jgi:hypothetical protein